MAIFDRALSASEISALMDGRYNPSDLLLTPGAALTYSATVTNTLATQGASSSTRYPRKSKKKSSSCVGIRDCIRASTDRL